jgi:membrane protease YdiL (CAAX protease family)
VKPSSRILLALVAAVVFSVLAAPLVKTAADRLVMRHAWARQALAYHPRDLRRQEGVVASGRYAFGRVWRALLLAGVAVALAAHGRQAGELLAAGFHDRPGAVRDLALGIGMGLASAGGLLLVLWASGARVAWWSAYPPTVGFVVEQLALALLAGGVAALCEEAVFRGVLMGALLRDRGFWASLLLADAAYVGFHLVQGRAEVGLGWDASVGLTTAWECLQFSVARPGAWATLAGVAAVGIVLGLAFGRSGSLFLPVGIHAGWVAVAKLSNAFFWTPLGDAPHWLYGGRGLMDGLIAWLLLAAFAVVVARASRPPMPAGPTTPP